MKEEGDNCFKNAQFEKAIEAYTKCLAAIPNKASELALKVYNNRAACYKQLSNFDGTIEDSTNVLEHDPDNVKALVRRAQVGHRQASLNTSQPPSTLFLAIYPLSPSPH